MRRASSRRHAFGLSGAVSRHLDTMESRGRPRRRPAALSWPVTSRPGARLHYTSTAEWPPPAALWPEGPGRDMCVPPTVGSGTAQNGFVQPHFRRHGRHGGSGGGGRSPAQVMMEMIGRSRYDSGHLGICKMTVWPSPWCFPPKLG